MRAAADNSAVLHRRWALRWLDRQGDEERSISVLAYKVAELCVYVCVYVCVCVCLCDEPTRAAVKWQGRAARKAWGVVGATLCGEVVVVVVVVQSGEEQWRETVDRGEVVIFLPGEWRRPA